jgi:hypothetical protein
MALVVSGSTRCKLCNDPLLQSSDVVAFPAFIPSGHPFHPFSDAAFHKTCFAAWEHHEALQRLFDEYQSVWNSRPRNLSYFEMEEWGKQAFKRVFG